MLPASKTSPHLREARRVRAEKRDYNQCWHEGEQDQEVSQEKMVRRRAIQALCNSSQLNVIYNYSATTTKLLVVLIIYMYFVLSKLILLNFFPISLFLSEHMLLATTPAVQRMDSPEFSRRLDDHEYSANVTSLADECQESVSENTFTKCEIIFANKFLIRRHLKNICMKKG